MSSTKLYQYEQLISMVNTIRLLKLAPSNTPDAEIHCNLMISTLHGAPEYEALSYVWGKDEFPNILHLPSGYLKITDSLASALRGLRLPDETRVLWVDAVCINQRDNVEKAQQVAQMASIYRNASGVVAWLGGETGATLDIKAVLNLSQKAKEIGLQSPKDGNGEIVRTHVYGNSERVRWIMDFMRAVEDARFPLIYESSWFTRMWIVQEALLAKSLLLCCCGNLLEWEDFERVMMLIHAVNAAIRLPIPGRESFIKHAWSLVEVRDRWRSSPRKSYDQASEITYYMHQLRRRSCKDDRDRVFALRGLLPDNSELVIHPDYSKTVPGVYTELTRSQLKLGNIGVLYDAGLWKRKFFQLPGLKAKNPYQMTSWSKYLPSWVPDYRKETAFMELAEMQFGNYFGIDPRVPLNLDLSKESYRLATQATLVDIITFVQPALFVHDQALRANDIVMFFTCRQFLRDLKSTFDNRFDSGRYPTDEDTTTAFAHALIGGLKSKELEKGQEPLDLWKIYEKCCISEDGEVYLAMQKEAAMPKNRKTVKGVGIDFYSGGSAEGGTAWSYHHHLITIFRRHWFFMSDDGYAGLAPLNSRPETDSLAFIDGANVPFVLRDLGDDVLDHVLVGPCYIHGLMDGETVKRDWASSAGTIHII
ncbi:MAG: hypothetical protein Q9166_002875 [cf. Caloplaca sp. 2 TL-2023]